MGVARLGMLAWSLVAIAPTQVGASPPSEEIVAAELQRLSTLEDQAEQLAGLDRLLRQLDEPGPQRAFVQRIRAGVLLGSSGRMEEAQAALEEVLRLTPDDPIAQLMAAYLLTYRNQLDRAADLWIQASRTAPQLAVQYQTFDLKALLGRLNDDGSAGKADELVSRMVAIGHPGASTDLRTEAARARTGRLIARGDVGDAAEAMRSVVEFSAFVDLYTDRRYQAIWPDMDRWTRGDLERQNEASLRSLRSDWSRGGLAAAKPYAVGLANAQAWSAVTDLFEPLMTGSSDDDAATADFDRAVLATTVAEAMVRQGRGEEALGLLQRLADQFKPDDPAAGLTARANLAQTQLELGKHGAAIASVERFQKDMAVLDGTGNRAGLAATQVVGACALSEAGRDAEALRVMADLGSLRAGLPPSLAWTWFSCRDDTTAAKALLREAFDAENRRAWAIGMMQPRHPDPKPSAYSERMADFRRRLTADPDVREAADRVGRVLPAPVGDSLPARFDPAG